MTAHIIDDAQRMFAYDFISRAFIVGTFIAASAGLVGYFVVLRNQVFAADSLSHVAFTGAMAAMAVGVDPVIGLFLVVVAVAIGMSGLGTTPRTRDVTTGVVFAWVLGLGVLFLSLYTTSRSAGNGAVGVNVLFGSIYGISDHQAGVTAALGSAVVVALLSIARPLLFASIDVGVASARGLPVGPLGMAFLALLGVTVGAAVQAVGALLIFGLLVTPAATAHLLTAKPYLALALSAALSLISLWVGLTLSYIFPKAPPSFMVIALAFAIYIAVVGFRALRRRTPSSRQRVIAS